MASPLAVLAPLVGNAAAVVAVVAHRRFGRPDVAGGLILGGGLLMTALVNDHGFGIIVGAAAALAAAAWPLPVGCSGVGVARRVTIVVIAVASVVVMWTSAYGVGLLSWSAAPAALVAVALLLLAGPATAGVGPRYRWRWADDAPHLRRAAGLEQTERSGRRGQPDPSRTARRTNENRMRSCSRRIDGP